MVNHSATGSSNHSDFSKKEEFRRYLEKSGVIDALTKVLVGLYEEPERPQNAMDYVKKYLGAPSSVDIDGLKQENEDLRKQLVQIQKRSDVNQK